MAATAALLGIGLQEALMEKQRVGEALDSFQRCAQALQSLDPKAVAQHLYEPSLLITPSGSRWLRTIAEVEEALSNQLTSLVEVGHLLGTNYNEIAMEYKRAKQQPWRLQVGGSWSHTPPRSCDQGA
jgi:hypothetical protein